MDDVALDVALANLRSHKWIGLQQGGDPAEAGSSEWVRYCAVCGMEDTCEDPLPPCPGTEPPTLAQLYEKMDGDNTARNHQLAAGTYLGSV